MNNLAAFCFMLFLFVLSCKDSRDIFVEQYGFDDFSKFENIGFLVRDVYKEDDSIYFVILACVDYEKLLASGDLGPYVIVFNATSGQIKETSMKFLPPNYEFDKARIDSLLPCFLSYNVYSLHVDNYGNVYVRIEQSDYPALIKFSDLSFKDDKYSDWIHVSGRWYKSSYTR